MAIPHSAVTSHTGPSPNAQTPNRGGGNGQNIQRLQEMMARNGGQIPPQMVDRLRRRGLHDGLAGHTAIINLARDHFNRMSALRDHQLRSFESQALDRLAGRRQRS